MPDFEEFEYKKVAMPKAHALQIPHIRDVLPFEGHRNPLTRSNTARRVSMLIPTPATNGIPRVYHFDGEAESAVALDALLDPDLHGLEVQLPPLPYLCRRSGRTRAHSFDLRFTFRDGFRRAVFVRNASSLARPKTHDEIESIFNSIPPDFADDAVVVNADHYTRAYRDNLRRIWHVCKIDDPVADAHVTEVAENAHYWLLKDLIEQSDLPSARTWQSALRLIARRVLWADWHAVINIHSKVQLYT